MEKREEDNLEWLKSQNRSFPNPPMPGNRLLASSADPFLPENHLYRLPSLAENRTFVSSLQNPLPRSPSWAENHQFASSASLSSPENLPFQLSNPEINPYPYHPTPLPNITFRANPCFHDNIEDPSLDADFSQLNLSTPSRYSPFPASSSSSSLGYAGGRFSIISPTLQNNGQYDVNLQRLRVQSAVMGQMGLNQYDNGRPGLAPGINRYSTSTINPRSNQNGFQSYYDYSTSYYGASTNPYRNGFRLDNNSHSRLRSINGFEANNSHPLLERLSPTLLELRGMMVLVAKDKPGCLYLQKKIEEAKPEEIDIVFFELKDHVRELMVDQFGNSLIQKFFGVCNPDQITQMLLLVISEERQFMSICCDTHGTHAMQKLIEHLTTQKQRYRLMSVLGWITFNLSNHMNGNHVIQQCLKNFSNEDNMRILHELADHCLDIATDKSGCCVLQQCLTHSQGEPVERLVAKIAANAVVLSENRYGNYVVQFILGMKLPHVKANILAQLVGNYVCLSMNKYSSNVVEKCLRESGEDQVAQIVKEIINSPNFLMLLQDPYGNYVAQSALVVSKGSVRQTMVNLVQKHYPFLHSHPYGKRVLLLTRGAKQQQHHVFASRR